MSKTFQEKFEKNSRANRRTDRKLLKEIDEKKQAQGQKFGVVKRTVSISGYVRTYLMVY